MERAEASENAGGKKQAVALGPEEDEAVYGRRFTSATGETDVEGLRNPEVNRWRSGRSARGALRCK